jgi:hypothetical protein
MKHSLALSLLLVVSQLTAQEKPPEEVKRPDGDTPKEHAQSKEGEKGKRGGPEMQAMVFLGVVTRPPSPEARAMSGVAEGFGLLVEEVMAESPAKAASIQRYDLITSFNDQRLVNQDQLAALVRSAGKDTEITLTIVRKGAEQKVTVKLGERMVPVQQEARFPQFGQVFNKETMQRFGSEMRDGMQRFGREMQQWNQKFHQQIEKDRPHPPRNQEGPDARRGPEPKGDKPHQRKEDEA